MKKKSFKEQKIEDLEKMKEQAENNMKIQKTNVEELEVLIKYYKKQ